MNPYAHRLHKAQQWLANAERRWQAFNDNAMPGTYVTGNSGVPASRRHRLDRQIERTVDLAKKLQWHKRNVARWQAKYDEWQHVKDNPTPPISEKKRRPPTAKQRQRRKVNAVWCDLSSFGRADLNGFTLRLLVGWCEEIDDSLGVVEIQWPDGAVSWTRAKSIQGVHLEETAR